MPDFVAVERFAILAETQERTVVAERAAEQGKERRVQTGRRFRFWFFG
jgi:hypothetical protein